MAETMGVNRAINHFGYGVGAFLGGFFILFPGLNPLKSLAIFGIISLVAEST